jgi:hypothetical protein
MSFKNKLVAYKNCWDGYNSELYSFMTFESEPQKRNFYVTSKNYKPEKQSINLNYHQFHYIAFGLKNDKNDLKYCKKISLGGCLFTETEKPYLEAIKSKDGLISCPVWPNIYGGYICFGDSVDNISCKDVKQFVNLCEKCTNSFFNTKFEGQLGTRKLTFKADEFLEKQFIKKHWGETIIVKNS